MKAIVYDKSSSANTLVYRDVETPVPSDDQVLVKIVASTVNASDYRSYKMGIIPKRKIFGQDIAGRIEAVGKQVAKFKIGDEVFGDISACGMGGFAEYVAVPETPLALKPQSVSFVTAATLPMAAVTALQGLRNSGQIKSGQKVLIYGAGGGVGNFAVQLAKYYGADVTAICGEKNVETIMSLGADRVINYLREDFTKDKTKYDLILVVNGTNPLSAYMRALAPKGICVVVGGGLSQVLKTTVFGGLLSLGSKKIRVLVGKPNVKDLEFVIGLAEEGKIYPIIDRTYPLSETVEAMRYISQGHARGKVVLQVE
jgi:NADPH:quinone reductase-like Zn-dependent oxidoreductase